VKIIGSGWLVCIGNGVSWEESDIGLVKLPKARGFKWMHNNKKW